MKDLDQIEERASGDEIAQVGLTNPIKLCGGGR